MKTVHGKTAYYHGHESKIILHKATAKALKALAGDGGKLPNPAALQVEYARLTEKKNVLRAEYGKLKKLAREYSIVERNVGSILSPQQKEKVKSRYTEL